MKKSFTLLALVGLSISTIYAQSPGGVSDSITCWLKANEGVTLNATNQVTLWNEYSNYPALGNFSTQGAAINKPTHVAPILNPTGLNFNPYIVFNSTATPNSISSANAVAGLSFLNATSNTIFQVINLKHATGTGVWLKWQWSASPYTSPRLGNEVNNGSNPGQVRYDFRTNNLFSAANILNQHSLMVQTSNATQKIIRLKGYQNSVNTTTGTFAPGTSTGKLTLGAEPYGDDYPTTIDIAEFIIYKRELTLAEVNKVESYLAIKYGMTLEQTLISNSYFSSNGSVVWNSGANAGYNNNITGIARDDASALNQKQSKSINANTFVTIYKGNNYGTGFPVSNNLNTETFASNDNYLVFGDNNQPLTLTACGANGRVVRLMRSWKMEARGNDGLATIAAIKTALPTGVTHLLVADDANFNTNATAIALTDNGTELYASHNFSGIKYFTFSAEPMQINAKADTVCFGGFGNITTNPSGGYPSISYSWNSIPAQNTSNLNNVTSGTYTITVTQGNGICSFTENHEIVGSNSNVEIFNIEITPTICASKLGIIQVGALGGTTPYSYSIDNGPFQTSNTFNELSSGRHTIRVRDAIGCTKDTIINLTAEVRTLTPTAETLNAWCDAQGGGGYALINPESGTPPFKYLWDNNIGTWGNKHTNLKKGSYNVLVTDYFGCTGTVKFKIEETPCCTYHLPTAFSPNEDGLNDIFVGHSSIAIPKFNMQIFDRWGRTVFVSGNYNIGWNGKDFKTGIDVENGVYFYMVEYQCPLQKDIQIIKGEVTLLR